MHQAILQYFPHLLHLRHYLPHWFYDEVVIWHCSFDIQLISFFINWPNRLSQYVPFPRITDCVVALIAYALSAAIFISQAQCAALWSSSLTSFLVLVTLEAVKIANEVNLILIFAKQVVSSIQQKANSTKVFTYGRYYFLPVSFDFEFAKYETA